jgi:glycosyltransferase involved in cell wall biosynthesis
MIGDKPLTFKHFLSVYRKVSKSRMYLRPFWHWLKGVGLRRRIRNWRLPPRGEVRVFYGHVHIPGASEYAAGGIVKFQRMQDLYPNSPECFNILYMVSSHLPERAIFLAKSAKERGVKLAWNQNGVAYPAWHGPGWERTNAPMAQLLAFADHVFYQSEFCRHSADRYLGVRQGPWEILYNSVDTQVFSPAITDPDNRNLVILLGGTQYQYYRFAAAIQTITRLTRTYGNVRLLVTGRLNWVPDVAEATHAAHRLVTELGVRDHVIFLGPYTQADAPAIYQRAHLLLHTKHNDPCPGLVVEAMACGLPVVYSDSGGVPELVGPDAGIGVPANLDWEHEPPPDPVALAEAVMEVAERRRAFSQAARQRAVEKFDIHPWLQRHREVFEAYC